MRESVQFYRRIRHACVLLLLAGVCFVGLTSAQPAYAACTYGNPNDFICPNSNPDSSAYDNPSGSVALSSPNGGNTSGNPSQGTVVAPGQTITVTLTYKASNTGQRVFAWINAPTLVDNITNSPTGSPGAFANSTYPFDNGSGPGIGVGCPAFWVGPTSPYQNAQSAQNFGTVPGKWGQVSTPQEGHTGCGDDGAIGSSDADFPVIGVNDGKSAIWSYTGAAAGSTYTYTAKFHIRDEAYLGSVCLRAHIAANGVDGIDPTNPGVGKLNAMANQVARSNFLCFQVVQQTVTIKTKVNGSASGALPIPRYIRGSDCTSADALGLNGHILTHQDSGVYTFRIGQGGKYCLGAYTPYNGYTLLSKTRSGTSTAVSLDNQVAGVYCQNDSSAPINTRCDPHFPGELLNDNPTDDYDFNYKQDLVCSGNCIPVGGKVSDTVTGDPVVGVAIYEAQDINGTCDASSTGPGTGGAMFTGADGRFYEYITRGAHFCLVPQGDYVQAGYPATGYHYKNPQPSQVRGQVAGYYCANPDSSGNTNDGSNGTNNAYLNAWFTSTTGQHCTGYTSYSDYNDGSIPAGTDTSHIHHASTGWVNDGALCSQNPDTAPKMNGGTCPGTPCMGSYSINQQCSYQRIIKDHDTVISADTYPSANPCTAGDYAVPAGADSRTCTNDRYVIRTYSNSAHTGSYSSGSEQVGDCSSATLTSRQTCVATRHTVRTFYTVIQGSKKCNDGYSGTKIVDSCQDQQDIETDEFIPYPDDMNDNFPSPVSAGDKGYVDYNFTYDPYVMISGRVYNSTSNENYIGAGIGVCNVGNSATGGDGRYSFEVKRLSPYCVRDPQYQYDPNHGQAVDGPFLNSAYQIGGKSYEFQAANTSRLDVDFRYQNPIFGGLNTVKHVYADAARTQQIDGQSVTPGQTLYYTITVTNTGDDTVNMMTEDFIPQNIDTTTLDWSANGNGASGMPLTSFGYNATPAERAYDCGACSNPVAPGYIYAFAANAPGSHTNPNNQHTLTIKWSGKVRAADTVGVFPYDYSFCANPGNWSTRGSTTTHTDDYYDPNGARRGSSCENYASGLQAVVNFARVGYHYSSDYSGGFSGWGVTSTGATDGRGGAVSQLIRNPIPGSITCVGKDILGVHWDNETEVPSHPEDTCGNPTGGGQIVYNNNSGYNTGAVKVTVQYDKDKGPVEYATYDQYINGVAQPFDTDMQYTGSGATPGNGGVETSTFGGPVTGALTWDENKTFKNIDATLGAGYNTYNFGVKLGGAAPLNHSLCNQAGIRWVDYSQPSHPVNFQYSPNLCAKKVGIANPYVTSDKGGVYAGGGISGSTCDLKSGDHIQPPAGTDGLHQKGTEASQGKYIVASTGVISNWTARSGDLLNQIGTPVCRPNALNDVTHASPSITTTNNNATIAAGDLNAVSASGKIVKNTTNNVVTLGTGGTLTISNRTTLYVKGDLYIRSNIDYDSAPHTLATTPSFGVVVDGNLYIDPSVTRLAGFYYVGSSNPSGAAAGTQGTGKINSCATETAGGTVNSLNFGPTPISPLTCSNQLQVNGFMQAYGFRFARTTPPGSCTDLACHQANASELVKMDPRFFLVTPPGFSTSTSQDNRTLYGGEQLPRY